MKTGLRQEIRCFPLCLTYLNWKVHFLIGKGFNRIIKGYLYKITILLIALLMFRNIFKSMTCSFDD